MAKYDTAVACINGAAVECGLTAVTDPYSSVDPAFVQLCQLLSSGGKELVGAFQWSHLINTYNLTTVLGDSGNYPLPPDFLEMIDQSGWSSTYRTPLGGPFDSQDWQMVTNNNTLASIYLSFRLFKEQISVWPQPPLGGINVNFEYKSRWWVGLYNSGSIPAIVPQKDSPMAASDIILFDHLMILKFLKVRFKDARGLDSTAAAEEFTTAFNMVTGQNIGAAVLSLTRKTLFPYLGDRNVPTTRYGL